MGLGKGGRRLAVPRCDLPGGACPPSVGLKGTLAAFSVPLEMSDAEVLQEARAPPPPSPLLAPPLTPLPSQPLTASRPLASPSPQELVPASLSLGGGLRAELLAAIHGSRPTPLGAPIPPLSRSLSEPSPGTRSVLLNESIARSVEELRLRIAVPKEGVEGAELAAAAALNESARVESVGLGL